MMGRMGEMGGEGFEGSSGFVGLRGVKGERGRQGANGEQGPSGSRGAPGAPVVLPAEFAGQFTFPGLRSSTETSAPLQTGKAGPRRLYRNKRQVEEADPQVDLYDFISYRLDLYRNPNGSREFPARTCKDLHMSYPNLKSGVYWIDPNGGISIDAIKVHCEFKKNASCLYPSEDGKAYVTERKKWYSGPDVYKWIGKELLGLRKLHYTSDPSQLEFLQLLSDRAHQRITYHCKNSIPWPNEASSDVIKSVKMLTINGLELHAKSSNKFKPRLVTNDCVIKDGSWRSTTIEVDTPKTHRLPVLDVAAYDIGGTGEEFGLEFGRVCFS